MGKVTRQLDIGSDNPRLQCGECGRWMRLHGKDEKGSQTTRFYGGCSATNGDHPCGGDVCSDCCPDKCRARLASLPKDMGGSLAESAD